MRNSEKDLRLPPDSPTPHQPRNPAMDRLRARIAAELAALNPSAVAGTAAKRLHGDVERRLLALVSALRTPTHPPYASMVHRAIEELNEGGGSSEKAISEFIVKEYENLPLGHDGILRHHLGKLCQRREVLCTVDGRYCLQVDGGAVTAVKKGVVGVERKSQKKQRGRKWGVSRPRGVKDRGVEETKNGEIGEENPWIELEIEGQTKAKEGRKGEVSRPSGVKDPGVEETMAGEIGEENGWIEQEIEGQTEAREMSNDRINEEKKGKEEREEVVGKLDKGNKEKNVAVKEQSEAERQDMEVTEEQIQMTGKKLNDEGGPNDEEILQAFINAKTQANEKKEDIEVGEQQHKTIQEQQLGISSEQIEPQPEQIEVIERQGEEEVQKKQQEKAKLNNKTISASPLNEENIEAGEQQAEMIEEQKLGISSEPKEIQPQQAEAIEKQIPLEEVQKQHQDCCGQQDITQEERGITASMPTPTTPLVGAIIDGQQVNLEKQSARTKKRSVPQQQDLHQSQLQRRKLRSYAWSSNPESATSSTILELSQFSQLHDELQKQAPHEGQEKQDQQRPPKQKRDENSNMQTELALDSHPYHEKQPPKRRRVRGMPLNPTQDIEAIKEASSVQLQNKQQHNQAQLPRRVLRSHNKEPSIPESAKPTMDFSLLPSEKQDMQRQQSQCQGRPPKQKIDVDTNAASILSLASKCQKEDLPLEDHGRRRSTRHKTNTDVREGSTVSLASQHHEEDKQPPKQHCRGRTSNLKTDTTLNAGSALSSALLDYRGEDEQPPKPHGQGGPSEHHAEEKQFTDLNAGSALCSDSQHHEEAMEQPPKRRRMGRPPNPIPSAYMLKRYGQGKPSKSKPSAYMGKRYGQGSPPIPKASARMLRKLIRTANMLKRDGRGRPPNPIPSEYMMKMYGKHQLRGKGGGKPSKAKQEAKSNADVILHSNTRLEKLKQKHTKGRGPGRPPKAK